MGFEPSFDGLKSEIGASETAEKHGLWNMGRSMGSGTAFFQILAGAGFPGDLASLRQRCNGRETAVWCGQAA